MCDLFIDRVFTDFTYFTEINLFLYCCTCSEADEIYKICGVIGSPTAESWADGLKLARDINYQFPQVSSLNLNVLLNRESEASFSLFFFLCVSLFIK